MIIQGLLLMNGIILFFHLNFMQLSNKKKTGFFNIKEMRMYRLSFVLKSSSPTYYTVKGKVRPDWQ